MYCYCALIENDKAVILSDGIDININLRSKGLGAVRDDDVIIVNATEAIVAANKPMTYIVKTQKSYKISVCQDKAIEP